MSDDTWRAFAITGYPLFVLVDGPTRSVVAETVAFAWSDVDRILVGSA